MVFVVVAVIFSPLITKVLPVPVIVALYAIEEKSFGVAGLVDGSVQEIVIVTVLPGAAVP